MTGKVKFMDDRGVNPLVKEDKIFQAALDEFSCNNFESASLNSILKAIKMNKGSFYYRFYDKTDLYLSMIHKIGLDKLDFFMSHPMPLTDTSDFFGYLKQMSIMSLKYAHHEPRYSSFFRFYLSESESLKNLIISCFPDFGKDFLMNLIETGISNRQFDSKYSVEFIHTTVSIYLNNIDKLIEPEMDENELLNEVDQLIRFLKNGLS